MIDDLKDKRIRAVLYGHEHSASVFVRNNILYAVTAPAGGSKNHDKGFDELHGPLDPEEVSGGEYHRDSYHFEYYMG